MRALVLLGALLASVPALADDGDGRVVLARGDVTVRSASGPLSATIGMAVHQGDQVRTGVGGSVRLLLGGNAVVDLAANTSLVVTRAASTAGTTQTRLKIWSGRIWARVSSLFGGESKFEVESPNAVAGVRGTELIVDVAADGATDIAVLDGSVAVTARDGGPMQLLQAGGRLSAKDGHTLVPGGAISESERHTLRAGSSAGLHLSRDGAPLRFEGIAAQLPHGHEAHRPDHGLRATERVQIPPIDIDPASGRGRLHGTIILKN